MKRYVVALDQGTTSSRAIIFDSDGKIVSLSQTPFPQIFPQPGWVEHDPMAILFTQLGALSEAFRASGLSAGDIAAIGITNQRETTIVWEKDTGRIRVLRHPVDGQDEIGGKRRFVEPDRRAVREHPKY